MNGWVFDDDDDTGFGEANIVASAANNTIVPAGGVAVLYPGDELEFMPARFNNAWGGGITLIGVDGFTALTVADTIGLWASHTNYADDALMSTTSPRRTFNHAATSFNYAAVDTVDTGHSIAWNGTGNASEPANWLQSEEGSMGAFTSDQTTFDSAQINSTDDRGNPGVLPAGPATAGLRITEIMFAPKSPLVAVDFAEDDFEWMEVFNNTNSPIDFASTNYVFDDIAGSPLTSANVTQGMLAVGGVGILFNGEKITAQQMETMWGGGINFIPVERWSPLNNMGGDTIAIWDSFEDYDSEAMPDSPRSYANAVAAVTYNTVAGQGWPTISDGSSIWLNDLTGDVNAGASWTRAGSSGDTLSYNATPIFQMAIDHPGGDVGSPGYAPGAVTPALDGDYNANGSVDAADYVAWRNALNTPTTLPNDTTPGSVTAEDYGVWRKNFGRTFSASALGSAKVPEPGGAALLASALLPIYLAASRATRNSCSAASARKHRLSSG